MTLKNLTKQQLSDFQRDGYLFVKKLFAGEELKQLEQEMEKLMAVPDDRSTTIWKFYEESSLEKGKRILNRIEYFSSTFPYWKKICTQGKVSEYISELLGEESILFKDKINLKLPGGDGFKPHQDMHGEWELYADYFISACIALDPSTIENGCLEVAAGEHKKGLIGKLWEPIPENELANLKFVAVPMEPGDCIFFDSFTPHQSAPNKSKLARKNIFLSYNKKSAGDHLQKYYDDKFKNYPPDVYRQQCKEYTYRV
jgi:ectoine hydroxylase-related dioxygenase (phytanoyl-CoA dioxygenase family)